MSGQVGDRQPTLAGTWPHRLAAATGKGHYGCPRGSALTLAIRSKHGPALLT